MVRMVSYITNNKSLLLGGLEGHALTNVELYNAQTISINTCSTTYTPYNKVKTISEENSNYHYEIGYYPNKNQAISILTEDDEVISEKHYAGKAFEYEAISNTMYHYVYANGRPVAVFIQEGEGDLVPYFIHTDRLGSVDVITDIDGNIVDSMDFDAWGNRRDRLDWTQKEGTIVHLIDRGFTFHQHLDVFNLINMGGRVYDPIVGQFLSPDPYIQAADNTQNLNRYAYCMHSPLMYVDPDGEFWHIIIGAAVGGIVNLATNWKNIDGFWQGMAAFGAGAASGALTAAFGYAGALAGGAITGATNNLISQTGKNFSGFNNVNWGQVGLNAGVGGIAGVAGYGAGKWASNNIGNVLINGFNIASPVLKGAISGAVGGAAGGYAGGFVGGLIMTGDAKLAHQSGMSGLWTGMGIGAGTGAIGGYMAAKNAGLNPWTGKPNNPKPSITIGEGMDRVNDIAKDINSKTISKPWPDYIKAYQHGNPTVEGLQYNQQWIEIQINQQMWIYDAGSVGNNSPYYNLELNTIQGNNYQNISPVQTIYYTRTIRIIYYTPR